MACTVPSLKKPVVGLTLDLQDPGSYSKFPWYGIRKNYASCLSESGACPIALPYDVGVIEAYLSILDGIVITGGDFDVDPSFYGEASKHHKTTINTKRTNFEFFLIQQALNRNIPLLGICGGQQLLHVALGGSLIQHIPDVFGLEIQHEQPNPRDQVSHLIECIPGTLLYKIVGVDSWMVNSAHHQAVKRPDTNRIVINAVASDGVIEGIESPDYKFCLGVQWHPEFLITPHDKKIIKAFVDACKEN